MKIITIACDRYADAAPAWLYLLRQNWPDCPYEPVFVTNKAKLDVDVPVHYLSKFGDMQFGWRLRTFLKQYYTDEHLLFMMVDYFIKGVNVNLVAAAHELCATPEVRHVRLRPMPHPPHQYRVPGFGLIDKYARYALSLQPGIWETQVLYDLCRDNENPWHTEIQGSIRAKRVSGDFISTIEWAIPHHNYYNKGKAQGLNWVRDNVASEAWPKAVKGKYAGN